MNNQYFLLFLLIILIFLNSCVLGGSAFGDLVGGQVVKEVGKRYAYHEVREEIGNHTIIVQFLNTSKNIKQQINPLTK